MQGLCAQAPVFILFLISAITGVIASPTTSTGPPGTKHLEQLLDAIQIPDANNIRESITLPTTLDTPSKVYITWKSSHPRIISDSSGRRIAPGFVNRPAPGQKPVQVTLVACARIRDSHGCRQFNLTVQPAVKLASLSRYGMINFARSNSQVGQQVYMAYSVGNDATNWKAANGGHVYLNSSRGMHAVRDPSIVRSPGNDKFYLVATDLNVDGTTYGWQGWDWAQSNASRHIEVWESRDLKNWSAQRHIKVAPDEAGMAYAPEAIWDPSIGAYVVYWTSSKYAPGTYYTTNTSDPLRRYPLTRNQILYATTRDFISFTPAQIMSGRPNHGALDAVIVPDDIGYYHRIVCDRTSTGNATTKYVTSCDSEDIYQERARSILAPPDEWELVAVCITHSTMNTTYAEAPLVVEANEGDVHGTGYYMYADQKWAKSPSGQPFEEQLHPYWSPSLADPVWKPVEWVSKPAYDYSLGVIRHGSIFRLTTAEHAALRGADLFSLYIVAPPKKICYTLGEKLVQEGLGVGARYSDGVSDGDVSEGYGGYVVQDFIALRLGEQDVQVTYTVLEVTKTTTFRVKVVRTRC